MPPTMPTTPRWDRLSASGPFTEVDRKANVIFGYVVAQRGPFKSGRGEFDDQSLAGIVRLMNAKAAGTKSRFTHPTMSSDGLGKFLGRSRNARQDGDKVRADLYLDPTSFNTPEGNLGQYVMDLAESDPDALSSSLVLQAEKTVRLDHRGRPKLDDKGNELPPMWYPTVIHASDLVDTGDAVDGLLSSGVDVDGLPLSALWRAEEMIDKVFAGQPRAVVEARGLAFLGRYLDQRFGPRQPTPSADQDIARRRLDLKRKL